MKKHNFEQFLAILAKPTYSGNFMAGKPQKVASRGQCQ